MKLYEITKAPYQTGKSLPTILSTLVQDAARLACDNVRFDLILRGGERVGRPLRCFLRVQCHFLEEQQEDTVEHVLDLGIRSQFRAARYILETVDREEETTLLQNGAPITRALIKQHPVHRANLSPVPYVQRPEIFRAHTEEVFSLLDGTGAEMIFQLVPTVLTDLERDTVRERAVSYQNSAQMCLNRDSIGEEAAGGWEDIVLPEDAPFALVGIFLRGTVEATAALAARMKGCYRGPSGHAVPFRNVNLGGEYPDLWALGGVLFLTSEGRLPGLYTTKELDTLCPLPVLSDRAGYVEGNAASLLEHHLVPAAFTSERGISLGLCAHTGQRLSLPSCVLAKSVCVIGETGSGKTTLAQRMAAQLDVPVIILTPAKDFRLTAMQGNRKIFRMNKTLSIAPFQLPAGVALREYAPLLKEAFEALVAMGGDGSPLPALFSESMTRAFARYNYRSSTKGGEEGEPFGLVEFMEIYHASTLSDMEYGQELSGNLHSAGAVRVKKLFEAPCFQCVQGLGPEELLKGGGSVIELGDDAYTSRAMVSILLCQLVSYLKAIPGGRKPLRAVLLVDEAHRLLDGGATHYATEEARNAAAFMERLFRSCVSELRKEGVGTILLDQSALRLPQSLMELCSTKVVFRLTGQEAEEAAKKAGLSDARILSHMGTGEAVVCSAGLHPTFLHTFDLPNGTLSDEDVTAYMADKTKPLPPPFKACSACSACGGRCESDIREVGELLAQKIQVHRRKDGPLTQTQLTNLCAAIPKILLRHGYRDVRLPACVTVHLCARIMMDTGLSPVHGAEHMIQVVEALRKEEDGFETPQ